MTKKVRYFFLEAVNALDQEAKAELIAKGLSQALLDHLLSLPELQPEPIENNIHDAEIDRIAAYRNGKLGEFRNALKRELGTEDK